MPPHSVYVEPFLGSGAIWRRKRPALTSILIDSDPSSISAASAGPGVLTIVGDALAELPKLLPLLPIDALIYADPPYLLQTRQNRRYYRQELTDTNHAHLLAILTAARCYVMLSGYPSDLYSSALRTWRCVTYTTHPHGSTRTECLWSNFPEPDKLHDWRYYGGGFRRRLALRRRAQRWLDRLASLSPLDRGYLLHCIEQRYFSR